MKKYIVYYRVSTKRQGQSGLGLDAQRAQVGNFLRERRAEILEEYTEVESGTVDERPQLRAAMAAAALYQVPILIAKLDRLSRSAAFLMTLQESGVQFTCCDMPDVCDMTVGVMALVARQERDAISKRTIAALAETKKRGKTLGGVREGQKPLTDDSRAKSAEVRRQKAKVRAARYQALIQDCVDNGCNSAHAIAHRFNKRGIPTATGKGVWQAVQVNRIMKRLDLTIEDLLNESVSD